MVKWGQNIIKYLRMSLFYFFPQIKDLGLDLKSKIYGLLINNKLEAINSSYKI